MISMIGTKVEPTQLDEETLKAYPAKNGFKAFGQPAMVASVPLWETLQNANIAPYLTGADKHRAVYAEAKSKSGDYVSVIVDFDPAVKLPVVRAAKQNAKGALQAVSAADDTEELAGYLTGVCMVTYANPDFVEAVQADPTLLQIPGAVEYTFDSMQRGCTATSLQPYNFPIKAMKAGDANWREIQKAAKSPFSSPKLKEQKAKTTYQAPVLMDLPQMAHDELGIDISGMETSLIPAIESWYVVPKVLEEKAQNIYESYKLFREPENNLGFYGDAGSGKSVGARFLAARLRTPYYRFLCKTEMEGVDVTGTFQPRTKSSQAASGLPSFEDIEMDWQGCYRQLFGKDPDRTVSRATVLEEVTRRMGQDTQNFEFVPSEIVRAMKYGGVVEIGEAEIVKNQGVLTALNNLLEQGKDAFIQLPTGERLYRHPLCIPVFTTNVGYAGCKSLNQSVLSRINEWIEMPTPKIAVIVKRTQSALAGKNGKTLFDDSNALKKMATVMEEMRKHAANDPGLADGSIGSRELACWAKLAYMYQARQDGCVGDPVSQVDEANIIRAAFTTVLSKTSQDPDGQAELRSVFEQQYGVAEVKEAEKELHKE